MPKIIIVGKGGSGKDYLKNKLEKSGYKKEISFTSRPKRIGEIHGKDYYFISKEKFEAKIINEDFYEYNNFNGWYYGTTNNQWCENELFIMTPTGISQIKSEDRQNCFIIYLDIDQKTIIDRLMKRIDKDSVLRRVNADEKDFENFTDYDIKITNSNF